ncbi:MAG: hypothetical protein DRI75_07515 [Bacteroidetes bacterium]|nr:MAG: hypothetical protein DRI75_07515 [Bacteroidota bacterium]
MESRLFLYSFLFLLCSFLSLLYKQKT